MSGGYFQLPDAGYAVGAGHFQSPSSMEVVGGAPQYNQKGKEDDLKGAVYIYNGRKEGISPTPSQRITGSSLGHNLRMFGQSLNSGIDIDDNGYKGKGSYFSRFATLYTYAVFIGLVWIVVKLCPYRCGSGSIPLRLSCGSQQQDNVISCVITEEVNTTDVSVDCSITSLILPAFSQVITQSYSSCFIVPRFTSAVQQLLSHATSQCITVLIYHD
ncbi:hypothetical protein GOODEAATRI_002896 [Goodea atripinnis]|uniref:Uncharacterized protein n=1 Tax=Goodea atripinnis TaxID=208336 RepID=A0ABV0N7E2_9TELE